MARTYFLHEGAYHVLTKGQALPKGAVKVPRLPKDGESWDPKKKKLVRDDGLAADMEIGADHRTTVHQLKALEAAVILSGFVLTHGLLAEEAKAIGVEVQDLARQVHDKAAALRKLETRRRKRKLAARA
jgi:hypothetical protein